MAIVPTLTAIQALAPAAGRLAGATQLFGPEQRERLAELEEPGITRTAQEQVAGYGQSLLAPILQSQQEQQQGLAQALTPAAAGGALGATARGFQGAEQRMARATEMPMMKIEEKRRKAELKEEKEQDELDMYRRSRRQQMLKETFAVIGAAAKGAQAFEQWAGEFKLDKDREARRLKALGIDSDEEITPEDQRAAAKRAGLDQQFSASVQRWSDTQPTATPIPGATPGPTGTYAIGGYGGRPSAAVGAAVGGGQPSPFMLGEGRYGGVRERARTQTETAAALQAIGGPAAEPGFEFEAAAPTAPPPSRFALPQGSGVLPSGQAFVKDSETGEYITVDEAYRRVQESRTGGRRRGR